MILNLIVRSAVGLENLTLCAAHYSKKNNVTFETLSVLTIEY